MLRVLCLCILAVVLSGCSTPPPSGESGSSSGKPVLIQQLSAGSALTVTSPDFAPNQPIPEAFSAYGANQTPTLRWSGTPAGTQSLVVLVEDPDAPGPTPYVHWLVYNIPGTATEIGKTLPSGAVTAPNSGGETGYFGPRPPSGLHHYHFQVFALDTTLPDGTTAERLKVGLEGHVLAKGELIGTYTKP